MYEEQLRSLGLFRPEQSRPRGGLMAACSSLTRGAEGQVLSSALWGQRQDPRERHGAGTEEGQAGCQEKILHPDGGRALGQAPQGSSHSTEPAGAQEVFGQHSQTHGLFFWGSCMEPGVGLDDPCGSLPTLYIL